jgi:hypothetical protein
MPGLGIRIAGTTNKAHEIVSVGVTFVEGTSSLNIQTSTHRHQNSLTVKTYKLSLSALPYPAFSEAAAG